MAITRWEYEITFGLTSERLNEAGALGWEVVACFQAETEEPPGLRSFNGLPVWCVLKRAVQVA